MEFRDYYATLGVSKTAADAEIKRAYRKLARQFHPDLNPGDKKAEARFKEINEAYEVLGDADSRRKYDELGANWRAYEQAPPSSGGPQGWTDFAGSQGGGYRTMTPEEMEDAFGGGGGAFSDFFQTFFGGAAPGQSSRGRRAPRPARGQDVEHTIELSLEDAFGGTTRRLVLNRDGAEKTIDVRIPVGVDEGSRIRAAGEGASGGNGGRAGDLYLRVALAPHPRFDRKGKDLHTKVEVPVTVAVLGGEVQVPTIAGTSLRLKVPELTPAGRTFRLRGHGMPAVGKPDDRGDLYAAVQIQLPTELSTEARQHYEALKNLEVR